MTKTFNWKIVARTYGALLLIEALFMAVPTVAAYLYGDSDGGAFAVSTLLTLVVLNALGLWLRQFNVPNWGLSEDPLPPSLDPAPPVYTGPAVPFEEQLPPESTQQELERQQWEQQFQQWQQQQEQEKFQQWQAEQQAQQQMQ